MTGTPKPFCMEALTTQIFSVSNRLWKYVGQTEESGWIWSLEVLITNFAHNIQAKLRWMITTCPCIWIWHISLPTKTNKIKQLILPILKIIQETNTMIIPKRQIDPPKPMEFQLTDVANIFYPWGNATFIRHLSSFINIWLNFKFPVCGQIHYKELI